jgi:hypothetical protein
MTSNGFMGRGLSKTLRQVGEDDTQAVSSAIVRTARRKASVP